MKMFSRKIDDKTDLCLSIPQYAAELYELTDRNRAFLSNWLPWLDTVHQPSDTESFLRTQLGLFAADKALHTTIFHEGEIAGVLAYNSIDKINRIGTVGYWLGEEFNGKGIMTACVRVLIELGERFYSLQRVEIQCATEKFKNRAIPERLGFENEGTLRRVEKVNDAWYDHVVYGIILPPGGEQGAGAVR